MMSMMGKYVVTLVLIGLVAITLFSNEHGRKLSIDVISSAQLERPAVISHRRPRFNELRIMVSILSYDKEHTTFLSQQLENFRDLCDAGSHVTVIIHTTEVYLVEEIHELNHLSKCRSSVGTMNISFRLEPKEIGFRLAWSHRDLFYEHLDDYDLFIYTEDEMDIRSHHISYFLDETEQLRSLVGTPNLGNYSIGFMRYEMNKNHERIMFDKIVDPNEPDVFIKENVIHDAKIGGRYFSHPAKYQGLFMALPEHLVAWRENPNCKFNEVPSIFDNSNSNNPTFFREEVSSLWLFSSDHCNVGQLVPLIGYHDSMVHVMSNYIMNHIDDDFKFYKEYQISYKTFSAIIDRQILQPPKDEYNGVVMINDDKTAEFNLTEYEEYVRAKGVPLTTPETIHVE